MQKPLVFDLFAGLGGWSDGFLAEGYDCIGFDIERHVYGDQKYPAQLVLQDVLTLHGSQFKGASMILASPPCTEYSFMAMPWKRAKQIAAALRGQGEFPSGYRGSKTIKELTALFDACFRLQYEASEAAGRHIPMVVENVKGAQPWVGRAKARFGSFYLWGSVEDVGGKIVASGPPVFGAETIRAVRSVKIGDARGDDWFVHHNRDEFLRRATKNSGGSWFAIGSPGQKETGRNPVTGEGVKQPSKSSARKAASAQIAKIPLALSQYIARCFWPGERP